MAGRSYAPSIQGIGRHYLRDRATLNLVEGEADRNTAIIKTTGAGKEVSKRCDRLIGVAVLDQQPRLFTPYFGCGCFKDFFGNLDGLGDQLLIVGGHATPSSMQGAGRTSRSLKSIPCGGRAMRT